MSQATTWDIPNAKTAGVTEPVNFMARLENMLNAQLSQHRGATRPSYAVAGTVWVDSDTDTVYLYDGASDIEIVSGITAAGAALLDDADAAAQRTTLGLGSAAVADITSGTWSVTFSDSSANTSATTGTGYYYTIGSLVFAHFDDLFNISTAGLTAGDLVRISLPFSAAANSRTIGHIALNAMGSMTGSGTTQVPRVNASANFANIVNVGGTSNLAGLVVSNFTTGVSDILDFTVIYEKA
ncbi:hypothetical protein [Actibacterium sp. MT2.3-13A]|uniref:hypothetical protein n=1 Tax=Actibacterium sp. MT2.3-13A TaxID=2828332 RepID=UPI001BA9D14D|nr:hypothetical protein [Actibacterium sp. MT2.3-13A]